MASKIAEAYVQIVPRIDGVASSINSQLAGPMSAAGVAGGNKFGSGLLSSIKRFAGPMAVTLGTVGVANFFKSAVTSASNFQAEFEGVNQTFGKAAAQIQEYAKTAASTAGMTETEALRSAKSFGVFAKSAGLSGETAAKFSIDMVQLAGDLGSFNDVPTADALAAIQSGLLGQSEPLRKFGVLLDDATLKARAMEMGIYGGSGALTGQQKVLAAQAEILAQTTLQQGDFIKYQDDFGNALKTTQSEFENVKKSVGVAFLPAMTSVVVAIRDNVIPGLKTMADALPGLFAKLAEPGGFVKLLNDGVANLVTWINGGGLQQIVQNFIQFRFKIMEALAVQLPAIITALGTSLVSALPAIIQTIITMIPQLLETAKTLFTSLITAFTQVIPQLIAKIVEMLPTIIKAITDALPALIQGAISLFLGIIDGLIVALPAIITALVQAIPQIIAALVDALPLIIDGAFKLFYGIIQGLVEAMPEIIQAVIGLIPVITKALLDCLPQLIEAGINIVKGIVKGIIDNAPKLIGAAMASVGDIIVNSFKDIMGIKSPSRVMKEQGVNVVEGIIVGINATKKALDDSVKILGKSVATKITNAIEIIQTRFDDLQNRIKTRTDFALNISSNIMGLGDLKGVEGGITGIVDKLKGAINQAKTFKSNMAALAAQNLNPELYKKIADTMDFETAATLVAGGTKAIEEVNTLYSELGSISSAFGSEVGNEVYNLGKNMATGFITVLEEGFKPLFDQMKKVRKYATQQINVAQARDAVNQAESLLLETQRDKLSSKHDIKVAKKAVKAANKAYLAAQESATAKLPKLATGGFVNKPTAAIVGEAGPEVITPLKDFERIMGLNQNSSQTVVYNAAPNASIDSEQALFQAIRRAKVVAGW